MNKNIVDKQIQKIDCKQGAVRAVRFSADGNYCISCGSDKSLKLWNPHQATFLKTYSGHGLEVLDAQGSCDNSQLCSCGSDKTVILWDVATGKFLRKYRGHAGRVNCVQFNEESTVILSGSVDSTVMAWDTRSRKPDPIQVMNEAKDSVTCLEVTDHEICTGSADGRVRYYDIRNGSLHVDYIGHAVTSVSLSRDGQCLLVSSMDGVIRLLDKDTGEMLNEYKGHKNKDYKLESVISSDDKQVLAGSEDGNVYIWDLVESKVLAKLVHQEGKIVHSLSYHPTETCLLTASEGHVYVWKSSSD